MSEFISQSVRRMAASRGRPHRTSQGALPSTRPDPGEQIPAQVISGLNQVTQTFLSFKIGQDEKEKVRRDRDFLSATGVIQQRFNIDLKRELLKYYTTDGQDLSPEEDYKVEIGKTGVQLTSADFISKETGRRMPYAHVVDTMNKRFREARSANAPSIEIEGALKNRLEEGSLRAMIGAYSYQDSRQGLKLANNLNSVVRAYKEAIHDEGYFSPDTFSVHMDAMAEAVAGSAPMVDIGASSEAFRVAMGDMLSIGLTDAMLNRENGLPFEVLREGRLLNTREVRKATAALPPKDQEMLKRIKGKDKMTFKKGSVVPDDKGQYVAWALAQLPMEKLSDLQTRSLESFKTQNQEIRAELNDRLKGVFSAVSSPLIKDIGHREQIEKSLAKAITDIRRVYPKDLFPQENAQLMTSALVGTKIMDIRNDLDDVHTSRLDKFVQDKTVELSNELMAELPQDDFIKTLPITSSVAQHLRRFVENEKRIRRNDPYTAIKMNSKEIRELDKKLASGKYSNEADRYRDQAVLRRQVIRRAGELGVYPSLLSGNDKHTLKTLADNGMVGEFTETVQSIRERYGDTTFYDHIAPEIAKDEQFKGGMPIFAMIPDPSVQKLFSDSYVNGAANVKLAKDLGISLDGIQEQIGETHWWFFDFLDRGKYGSYLLEPLDGFIDDRFVGQDANRAKSAMRNAIYHKAVQYMVSGQSPGSYLPWASQQEMAVDKAVDLMIKGIGRSAEFNGKHRILPKTVRYNEPRLELLNDVLYNDNFINERVLPYVEANPHVRNHSKEWGIPVTEVYKKFFDQGTVDWRFYTEGVVPVVEDLVFPDLSYAIPNQYDEALVIPYEELDTLMVNPRYSE